MARGKKWTQDEVDAWLAANRPDFVPDPGWVYVNNRTPIPGECRVCGAGCAPRLNDMKFHGGGHCDACAKRAVGEAQRARGEAEARRVATKRGYEVVGFFAKQYNHSRGYGVYNKLYVTLRCDCGNEWDVQQSDLCSSGKGCSACAEFGYNPSKPGAIYLLSRTVDGVRQQAYGISNDWMTRWAGYKRFGWELTCVLTFEDGAKARSTETMINRVVSEIAGRSVEPDSVYYKNKEAFAEGHGIPMFPTTLALIRWAEAQTVSREVAA